MTTGTTTNYEHMFRSFGLKENPFHVSPDPRYLFCGPAYETALAELMFGIESHRGLLVLTGEAGTGKTTLLRHFLQWLKNRQFSSSYIFHTHLDPVDLLQLVLRDFGVDFESGKKSDLLAALHRWLHTRQTDGDSPVIVIDEAQALSQRTLNELGLLLNLENTRGKLVQLVLAGQPELEEKLRRPELRALRQRIMARCRLPLLSLEETGEYITSRLRAAGNSGTQIFPSQTVETIYSYARGIPRMVNLLCEQALIGAYADRQTVVSSGYIRRVAAEFDLVGTPIPLDSVDIPARSKMPVLDANVEYAKDDRPIARDVPQTTESPATAEAPVAAKAPMTPTVTPPVTPEMPLIIETPAIAAPAIAASSMPAKTELETTVPLEATAFARIAAANQPLSTAAAAPQSNSAAPHKAEIRTPDSPVTSPPAIPIPPVPRTAPAEAPTAEVPTQAAAKSATPSQSPVREVAKTPAPAVPEPVMAKAPARKLPEPVMTKAPARQHQPAPVASPNSAPPSSRKRSHEPGWHKRRSGISVHLTGLLTGLRIYWREVVESFVRDWRHFFSAFTPRANVLAGSVPHHHHDLSLRQRFIEPLGNWLRKPINPSRTREVESARPPRNESP